MRKVLAQLHSTSTNVLLIALCTFPTSRYPPMIIYSTDFGPRNLQHKALRMHGDVVNRKDILENPGC